LPLNSHKRYLSFKKGLFLPQHIAGSTHNSLKVICID
jgi:hypothetical protein